MIYPLLEWLKMFVTSLKSYQIFTLKYWGVRQIKGQTLWITIILNSNEHKMDGSRITSIRNREIRLKSFDLVLNWYCQKAFNNNYSRLFRKWLEKISSYIWINESWKIILNWKLILSESEKWSFLGIKIILKSMNNVNMFEIIVQAS